ncbi:MAG: radical SAM protein [Vampirovibrionales bacterium]|nr:radical SAM protein [Vampirovibrionales bacterium]
MKSAATPVLTGACGSFSLLALPQESPFVAIGKSQDDIAALGMGFGLSAQKAARFAQALYAEGPEIAARQLSPEEYASWIQAGYHFSPLTAVEESRGSDGSLRLRCRLLDGRTSEAVLIPDADGLGPAACLSALAGCALGCVFCGTGRLGFEHQLKPSDMLAMFAALRARSPRPVMRAAFMGQGEPLMNLAHVISAIAVLTREWSLSPAAITVSTAGLPPQMARLAQSPLPPTLVVSLHASDDTLRQRLIPVARKWPLSALMPAVREYARVTRRPVTIQYMLLADVNDAPEQAHALGTLLRDLPCEVALSRYNPVNVASDGPVFTRPSVVRAQEFLEILRKDGLNASLRADWGAEIDAGCGQLVNR